MIVVFILSALWWIRLRGLWTVPDGWDWLWGKLGLVLMGGAMLSKSLTQFSVDREGCVPSLLFDLWPNYGGGHEDNGDLLQKVPCMCRHTQCPWPWTRPPLTHASTRDSWTLTSMSGSVFCGAIEPFSWFLVHTRFCLYPPKSLFPQSHVSCVIKSYWPPKSNSLGVFSPFARSQVGKSAVGPRTFLTVREFLWYNCFVVCGSSARQLYGGVNGDLLQEGLCHRLCDQVSCTQSPCPWSRPLLTCTSTGDTQQTVENSSRYENTRPPYLPPEKSLCKSRRSS